MLKKIIRGHLEVKEVVKDKEELEKANDKVAELEKAGFAIRADGSVGIGTATPTTQVDIK